MTTIAYKAGIMACDSAWSDHCQICTRRPKLIRTKAGGLLGEAGDDDSRDVLKLFDHVKNPRQLPSRKELLDLKLLYSAIFVMPNGRIYSVDIDYDDERKDWAAGLFEVNEPFYAVGSGMSYALGVMEFGGSARDAVAVACRRDISSRTPVHTMSLSKPR